MFQDNQVLGVIIAMVFISACIGIVVYFTRNLIAEQKILFLLIFIMAILNGVFVTDKVIAFRTHLLTEKETDIVLQMDLMVASVTLGYYLKGDKKETK